MKALKYKWLKVLLILAVAVTGLHSAYAQNNKKQKESEKAASVRALLESKNYVFKPQTALPTSGTSQQLTQDFELKVTGDTVQSYLPYFGRAFSATIGQTEGGIRFTSTDFGYTIRQRRKGDWEIGIQPKDAGDVRQLLLRVSENGYGTLQVTSNNRQPISFNGYVAEASRNRKE